MSADVSRAIARFAASLNIGRDLRRELVAQFGGIDNVDDLPEWIREVDAEATRSTELDEEVHRASSALDGDDLEAYWTRGEGLARWSTHPHPWRRLRGLLRKHPRIRDPEGLASHYFHIVFGIWPGERKGSNPVGPG